MTAGRTLFTVRAWCASIAAAVVIAGIAAVLATASAPKPIVAQAPSLHPQRGAKTMLVSFALTLRDAAIVRTRRGAVLRGRPTGTARLHRSGKQTQRLRLPARALAATLDGIVGGERFRASLGRAGRRQLSAPRLRGGVLRLTLSGRRPRSQGLGRLALRGSLRHRAVPHRGRCVLAPFASCANARLTSADLLFADVRGADLRGADLHAAYAHGAQLGGADLRGADLRGADLTDASLRRADLRGANLADATLGYVDDLGRANLRGAYLCAARLPGTRARTTRHCRAKHPPQRAPRRRVFPTPPPLARSAVASAARPASARAARVRARAAAKPRARAATHAIDDPIPDPPPFDSVKVNGPIGSCVIYWDSRDNDRDGLSDCYEATEHTVAITSVDDLNAGQENGHTKAFTTTYNDPDTDDDTLADGQEYLLKTDPTSPDSDGDRINDRLEIAALFSNPIHADSDSDAKVPGGGRDPNLYDGSEVAQGTGPIDPDTDGDGYSDFDETRDGSGVLKPAVANIPSFEIRPKENTQVSFALETRETVGTSEKIGKEEVKAHAKESKRGHEFSVEMGLKFSQEFEFEQKVGSPESEVKSSQKFGFEQSVKTGTTNTWETTESFEEESRDTQEKERSTEIDYGPATCVQAVMTIANTSNVAFNLSEMAVIALTPDPENSEESRLLATMQPVAGEPKANGECPGIESPKTISLDNQSMKQVDVTFAGSSSPEAIREYWADPKPITFELSTATIRTDRNEPFTAISTQVNAKDVTVVVDYGSHAPQLQPRLQRFNLAGSVAKRLSGGQHVAAGISAHDALNLLGFSPEYAGGASRREKLVSLGGVRNQADPNKGLWTVVGSASGVADDRVDFPDIKLIPGDEGVLVLTYIDDQDNDGLSSLVEPLHGTNETNADSDGDGLTDKFEMKEGWTVPLPSEDGKSPVYNVKSSPLTCDSDGDGSPDGPAAPTAANQCPAGPPEFSRASVHRSISGLIDPSGLGTLKADFVGTDPKLNDTNRDGLADGPQPYPNVLRLVEARARAPVYQGQFGAAGDGGGKWLGATDVSAGHAGTVWVSVPGQKRVLEFQPTPGDADPYVGQVQFGDHPIASAAISEVNETSGQTQGFRGYAAWEALELSLPPEMVVHIQGFHDISRKPVSDKSAVLSDSGHELGTSLAPTIATGPGVSGNVYVAFRRKADGVRRVAEYTSSGRFVREFKGVIQPTGIAVDRQGNVFVADNTSGSVASGTIRKYSARTGAQVASSPSSSKLGLPYSVGVDGNGYVYATYGNTGQGTVVAKYTNSLTHLTTWGSQGKHPGQFQAANGVDADVGHANDPCVQYEGARKPDDRGAVSVLDGGNNRVQQFVYPFGEGGTDPAVRAAANCGS